VVVLFFPQGAYPTLLKLGGSMSRSSPKPPHRI